MGGIIFCSNILNPQGVWNTTWDKFLFTLDRQDTRNCSSFGLIILFSTQILYKYLISKKSSDILLHMQIHVSSLYLSLILFKIILLISPVMWSSAVCFHVKIYSFNLEVNLTCFSFRSRVACFRESCRQVKDYY